jgi:predicted flavoprotein YhiN
MKPNNQQSTRVLINECEIAYVLRVDGRFFLKFDKSAAVVLVWSLARAHLFAPWLNDEIIQVRDRLERKGYESKLVLLDGGAL